MHDKIVWQAKISVLSWLFADCLEFLFQRPRSVLAHFGIFLSVGSNLYASKYTSRELTQIKML